MHMERTLEELCAKIGSGDVEDSELLALAEAIGDAIDKGKLLLRFGIPVAQAVRKAESNAAKSHEKSKQIKPGA